MISSPCRCGIDAAIAAKGREHLLVAEILAPGFELLRRPAEPLAELDQGVAEGVRIEIGKPRADERLPKIFRIGSALGPEAGLQPING